MRHSTGNTFDVQSAVDAISGGMALLESLIPRVTRLARMPLSVPLLSRVAGHITLPDKDWAHILKNLEDARDM